MLDVRVLKVVSVASNPKENSTVTLAPQEIRLVVVFNDDPILIREQEYKHVRIVFNDGEFYELTLGEFDIDQLETLVGGYGVPID